MGIRALDNNQTVDHKEFMETNKNLVKEVTTLKDELTTTLDKQAVHSKQLEEETYRHL